MQSGSALCKIVDSGRNGILCHHRGEVEGDDLKRGHIGRGEMGKGEWGRHQLYSVLLLRERKSNPTRVNTHMQQKYCGVHTETHYDTHMKTHTETQTQQYTRKKS